MASLDVLHQAFEKAKSNGDVEMAKHFAQQIVDFKQSEPEPQMSPGGDSKDIMTPFMEGAAFGLSDEAQGGVAALYAKMHRMITGGMGTSGITGEEAPSFQQNYETVRDQVRADQDAFAKANPKADLAAKIAGGVLTGGYTGAKALGTNLAKSSPKLALPVVGAAEGAAFGFGEGEGLDDSLDKAGTQAAISAIATPALSGIMNVAGRGIQKGLAKIKYKQADNTLEDLKIESQAFYDAAEESGIKVRPGAFAKFIKKVKDDLKAVGVDIVATPKTPAERGVFNAIRRMENTKEPTYQDLAAMRTLLDNAKKSTDGAVSDAAYQVSNKIDDFIGNLKPGNVSAGSAVDLAENLTQAKSYWSRMEQGKTLANARRKAELSEANIIDDDLDKAIRSTNRSITNPENPRRSRGIDKKVLTKLDDMIEGGGWKNFWRSGAAMDPGSATRRGISPAIGGGALAIAGAATMGPAGLMMGLLPLMPPLLGAASKKLANKITKKEYAEIERAVLNKDLPSVEQIVQRLQSKYESSVGGIAAGIAGSTSSTLGDMISP